MRISLRLKLTLISLLLFLIPLIGFRFSAMLQTNLLASREDALMFTARAVATSLGNRPDLFEQELFHSKDQNRDLYLFSLSNSIRLNGKADDWQPELNQSETFGAEHLLGSRGRYNPESLRFNHLLGQRGKYLYGLFQVQDDHIVYRHKNSLHPSRADHIQIGIQDISGTVTKYILATDKPGWVNGFQMDSNPENLIPVANEPRIQGVWTETDKGYIVEMRMPLSMVNNRLSFAVADVDDENNRVLENLIGTATPEQTGELGWLLAPSKQIETLLAKMDLPHSRIRVVDENRRVRARFGKLQEESRPESYSHRLLAPVYRLFTEAFSEDFKESNQAKTLDIQGIEEGLKGTPNIIHYQLINANVEVMAAITPLFNDGRVVGAVVVEQTTNSILALKNRIIEESITFTIISFVVIGLGLLLFASRISSRIRHLRNQAGRAISKDGRIVSNIAPVSARDEIGDLSRTLSSMLSQLQEQNQYRETMADNLEHEMRTPLAGISASLKNLEQELKTPSKQIQDYMSWALADVQRMESLLTAIRDATTLEQALKQDYMEVFDLAKGLSLWLERGWQIQYPDVKFVLQLSEGESNIQGDADRMRQMIEKLIDNAVSFHQPDTPIILSLTRKDNLLVLQVSNQGPEITSDNQGQIFNSMVSLRSRKKSSPHLGLGLYVVRAITQHHEGTVRVENLTGAKKGVCFIINLPACP
jgi:two-component system, OmpR family, sensor histidine kinase ChvG